MTENGRLYITYVRQRFEELPLEISFEDFRCFAERQSGNIAPITLLVGENSAGKSTFMAGLRYMLDFIGSGDASFNKDPFFLGGFKNIAHSRRGKRAETFSIGMIEQLPPARRHKPNNLDMFDDENDESKLRLELRFSDIDGEAVPTEYDLRFNETSVVIQITAGEAKALVYDKRNNFKHELRTRQTSKILTIRHDIFTLEYFLRDLAIARTSDPAAVSADDHKASNIVERIWNALRRLGPYGPRRPEVYALAPVRTRPLRSYDPTQLSDSSEGDQLLSKLGRMARLDPENWASVKANLERYGSLTGLFDSIKIHKLGRGDSDPFQIVVRASGREANIIDVGYGVSQILPFFVILTELSNHSTLLLQQPEVHLHPSAQAALGSAIADAAASHKRKSFVIETHSDFIVDRIRIAVREGKLKESDVQILFFEKARYATEISSIKVNASGEMINPPNCYRKFFLKESMDVMGF